MWKQNLIIFILALTFFGCKNDEKKRYQTPGNNKVNLEKEQFRPQFHFTPKAHWMNDPNGLVYTDGYYHLFYQYYPDSTVWGPMHWGHAKSSDLLHWKHQPVALAPDNLGYIFSGSAVMDKNNTSGFGKNAMIAMFTYSDPKKEAAGRNDYQTQGIAYSLNDGETWTKYAHNPVIKNPGTKDFRDPKVFWNSEKKVWQVVLAVGDHIEFYESPDIKNWHKLSDFRFPDDPPLGVWECPDLFKLQVENSQEEKWVLLVSHGGDSAPNGGSGTRYFVGDFDGTNFTTDQKESQWVDYGTDDYAGVTYNNAPDQKRLFIGWMSNWEYAQTTPTKTWRSAMTLPRQLSLFKTENEYNLRSTLVGNFNELIKAIPSSEITGSVPYNFQYRNLQQSYISFDATITDSLQMTFSNSKGEKYVITYYKKEGVLIADRTHSGLVDFNKNFKKMSYQTIPIGSKKELSFVIVLDASSSELFIDRGAYVLTNQIFPTENYTKFDLNSDASISNFTIKYVQSIFD